ncbi:trx1 [Symbiodinium sp. KB8]|nr:trx1 [Symbiodinium sp. KB8]
MPTVINTTAEWTELMEKSKTTPVVVDFYADWCGPCKMVAPHFQKLADEHSDVTFAKVDVDNEDMEDTIGEVGIAAMPTFMVFKDGKKVATLTGADQAKLTALVEDNK